MGAGGAITTDEADGVEACSQEFNELVNMSADELEAWLKTGDSSSSGWQGGSEDGETVGEWL